MPHFIEDLKQNNLKYNFLLFSLMALTFSIPFGNTYSRMTFPFVIISWLMVVKWEDLKNLFKHRVIIVFSLYIFVHIISLLWSEHVPEGINYISNMFRYGFLPIIIVATTLQKKEIHYIITAFVLSMFANEIISYLIYFDLYQTEYSKVHHWPVGFINHIPYSVLVAFTAILILYQARHMKNKWVKSIYIIFFMTMTTNLVISSGRTGYAAYFGTLIILLFTYYKLTLKNFLGLLIFPTLVFFGAYNLDSAVQTRVNNSFQALEKIKESENYNSSLGARLAFYPMSIDILQQKGNSFLTGTGTGDIYSDIQESTKRTKILKNAKKHLHNSFLTAYVNTGLAGLILLIFTIYLFWKLPTTSKEILFIKQLLILIIVISSFGDVILSIKSTMIFFAVFSSILLVAAERKEGL